MHHFTPNVDAPVYGIGVAAAMAGMHQQTLRQYDRLGLVVPQRTIGRTRLYSLRDIARLNEIAALSSEGVNLIGIARILALETENGRLRQRVAELSQQSNSTAVVVWRPHQRRN
jgi:MerR family transcriptional regulator/heat shock protein HspR